MSQLIYEEEALLNEVNFNPFQDFEIRLFLKSSGLRTNCGEVACGRYNPTGHPIESSKEIMF